MLAELGLIALLAGLLMAFLQVSTSVTATLTGDQGACLMVRRYAIAQFMCIASAFGVLMLAFYQHDFSIRYVAEHSSTSLPWFYRICAVWGAHEGSVLLWLLMLCAWTALIAYYHRDLPADFLMKVLGVLAALSIGFNSFILLTSNPFLRLLPNPAEEGLDLNPLLQDPGFVFHPPTLYMGYVGFAVCFAYACAFLLSEQYEREWARWVRPWTLMAWCFLTWGITMGSWWAYRELGWGGWWFWDPVENASFMPWLVGTALLHSLSITAKRGALVSWTVVLSITAFALSLLGTFLVRSGVLTSVHAFAVDPARGTFLLLYLSAVVGAAFLLVFIRGQKLIPHGKFALLSRPIAMLFGNIMLFIIMSTVLLGTLYPLLIDALGLGKLSVGAPYFNAVFLPLILPVLLLMGVAPHLTWQSVSLRRLRSLVLPLVIAIVISFWVTYSLGNAFSGSLFLGVTLALWLICSMVDFAMRTPQWRSQWPMIWAHVGVAVTVLGISVSVNCQQDRDLHFTPGDVTSIGPYHLAFNTVVNRKGDNYDAAEGLFTLSGRGKTTTLTADKRIYSVSGMPLSHAGIDVSLWRDVYVAMAEPLDRQAWAVRVYYKPLVRWIWAGGVMMTFAGILALWLSQRRVQES